MTDVEEDVQSALALIQTSIKQHGGEDSMLIAYKKCNPITSAQRGHKFLKEHGFVTATARVGTFVCPPYSNLTAVFEAIMEQYGTTLQMRLYSVNSGTTRGRGLKSTDRSTRHNREHINETRATRAPRTRVTRHDADVVQVSSSEEEMMDSDQEHHVHMHSAHIDARYDPQHEYSAEIEDEVDVASDIDSTEIMNTSDVRAEEYSDEDDAMTGVKQRSAEQFSTMRGRFELQQQKFVKDFNARSVQHNEIMMTIKLFGATIPVPKNTIVFQPQRDAYDSPDDA